MRLLPAVVAALLLPAAQPLLLGAAVSAGVVLVSQAPARAQSAEVVAEAAKTITVRIEGATQGSGVLVKRDGNRYTVLTAWHVVSGQRPGEELDIYTPDGQRHAVVQGSIKHLGDVDLAVLSFSSTNPYEVARVGDVKSVSSGSGIYVAGFPLPTSAVPTRIFRFLKGDVIANATVAIPNGYQLLYSNPTLPGMSGGAVLNAQGQLVGVHASAERADQISEKSGKAVATGTNQAVPITYFSQYVSGDAVVASSSQATSADDYLAQAKALIGQRGREQEIIRLTNQALAKQQSAEAYFYRALAKYTIGDNTGAIADSSKAIDIKPQLFPPYITRGHAKSNLGDNQSAIADLDKAIAITRNKSLKAFAYVSRGVANYRLGNEKAAFADFNQAIINNPQTAIAYYNRGVIKFELGDKRDKRGSIADFNQALAINPQYAEAYAYRGLAKSALGDKRGAIADFNQALAINPQNALAYFNRGVAKIVLGDMRGAISDFNQALTINPQDAFAYIFRGNAKLALDEKKGAIADYNQALTINPQVAIAYRNRGAAKFDLSDKQGASSDFKAAVSLGSQSTIQWLQSDGGAWCRNMP